MEEVYFDEMMTGHTEHMDNAGVVWNLDTFPLYYEIMSLLKSTVALMNSEERNSIQGEWHSKLRYKIKYHFKNWAF